MPKDIDDWIVAQLAFYERLTVDQLCRLRGWKPATMKSDMGKRLRFLEGEKRIKHAPLLMSPSGRGNAKNVYFLKGVKVDNTQPFSAEFWRHTLVVNDFLISLHRWELADSTVQITNVLTEPEIYRDKETFPIQLPSLTVEAYGYQPDGWIELTLNDKPYTLLLEVERKRYGYERWAEKVAKLVAYRGASGMADELLFPILARDGEEHRKQLLKWTSLTLKEMQREDVAPVIKITDYDPEDSLIVSSPVWWIPSDATPHTLIEAV